MSDAARHTPNEEDTAPSPTRRLITAVSRASPVPVETGLRDSGNEHVQHKRFLSDFHPQLSGGSSNTDIHYPPEAFEDAAKYAAAISIAHYSDSWSYFSQAIRAILAGELSIARHLLYYSELRSAFSVLARHGIVIRSSKHFALSEDSIIDIEGLPTHEAVWIALKAWMKLPSAKELFLDRTLFGGRPLAEWLDAANGFQEQSMAEIFAVIGYDLSDFVKDRSLRNSASYGARFLKSKEALGSDNWFSDEIARLWSLLEPLGASGFERLDAEFSALVINGARRHKKQSLKREKYLAEARALAEKVGSDQPATSAEILVAVAEEKNYKPFMKSAVKGTKASPTSGWTLNGMVARAFLLARFAGASVEDLVKQSGIDITQLDFWFASVGAEAGLWDASGAAAPSTLAELFEDIMQNVEVLVEAQDANNLAQFLRDAASGLHGATRFGAVTLWFRGDFDLDLPLLPA